MADYEEQMRMIGFLRDLYPGVKVSLHAGELAPGLVPPEGLCCHVRQAVEVAKAERVGHGVDVMYEDRPYDLLKDMAAKGVLVETNLTSNAMILGVEGKTHPFSLYRKFGVPVALSTETYGLRYEDLKQLVRNSLEYSFLPGASLFEDRGVYSHVAPACSKDGLGSDKPSSDCKTFIDGNEKAEQHWELERRFNAFEAAL